jgi:hypothetical protein
MRIFKRNQAPDAAVAVKGKKKGRIKNAGKGKATKEGKEKEGGGKKTTKDGKKRSSRDRSSKDSETASTTSMDSGSNSVDSKAALEGVMKDNLELMLEIIMRIREDEDYAKNIYADCPRLQHLLDRNPELRPIFEDPNLVRSTFNRAHDV